VARLTYAALALALGALVSGFFIRTTAVPLFASIGLSALVLILILRGWARRIRQSIETGEDLEEAELIEEIEEIEATDIVVVEPGEESAEMPVLTRRRPAVLEERERAPRSRPARPPRTRASGAAAGSRRVVVLPGRTRYHAPNCRFARGKGAEEISESTARRRHFQPCSVCLG
jgi:hypothetical protein